jgi:hypothetical protein
MTTKTQKVKRRKFTKLARTPDPTPAAVTETPNEQRRKKAQAPLEAMIAGGKDRREAALLFTIAKVLDRIGWRADDSEMWSMTSPKEKACHSSIRWNSEQVLRVLICEEESYGVISPKSWVFHTDFAEWWREFRFLLKDLFNATEAMGEFVGEIAASKPRRTRFGEKRLFRKLEHLQGEAIEKQAELCSIIAFCLGVKAHERQVARQSDRLKLEIIAETKMETPDPDAVAFKPGIHPEALRAQLKR